MAASERAHGCPSWRTTRYENIIYINEPTTTALMLMVLTAAFRFLHTLDLQVQRLSFIARLVACAMH
jgi:hypothetical protein